MPVLRGNDGAGSLCRCRAVPRARRGWLRSLPRARRLGYGVGVSTPRRTLQVTAFAAVAVSCCHEGSPCPRAVSVLSTSPRASVVTATEAPPSGIVHPAPPVEPVRPELAWLEEPITTDGSVARESELWSFGSPGRDLRVLAIGNTTVVVATRLGLFTLREDSGIRGPLSLPGDPDPATVRNLGFGTFEQLVYADPEGRVWVQPPGSELFEARGQVPGAVAWDFAHGILAAINEQGLWLSEDGVAFRRAHSGPLQDVVVRDDGVVVVRMGEVLSISKDRGWQWSGSEVGGRELTRAGQWISVCRDRATLSADGQTWVKSPPRPVEERQWFQAFTLARMPAGFVKGSLALGALRTAPAAKSRQAVRGTFGCGLDLGGFGRLSVLPRRPAPLVPVPSALEAVAAWPVAPRVPETRTTFAFLANGECEPRAVVRGNSACPPGARFTRMPSIAAIDRSSLRAQLRDVPEDCQPQDIADASGAAVVLCASPPQNRTARLLSVSQTSPYREAPQLEDGVPFILGQARDGTLALVTGIEPLTIAVRAPNPMDASDAWRTVRIEDAISYRIAPGGSIVAVTLPSREPLRVALRLISPTGDESTLVDNLDLGEGLEAVEMDGTEVVVRRRTPGGQLNEERFDTSTRP